MINSQTETLVASTKGTDAEPGSDPAPPPWDAQEYTATLQGWALREMAPWLFKDVNPAEFYETFDTLNKTYDWSVLYEFSNRQVSILPKPDEGQPQSTLGMRAGLNKRSEYYLNFFSRIAETLPKTFRFTLCMDVGDAHSEDFSAPVFCFQKKREGRHPLLPDIDFLTFDFYSNKSILDIIPYEEKTAGAVFSGSTTGAYISADIARTLSMPRLRAAGFFQDHERVDFRLPVVAQVLSPEAQALLEAMPFCRKPRLDWQEQFQRRFILSMDGNGATCSRVLISLLSNSVLLKYDSDKMLYYFWGMQPWVHYVPVADDGDVENILNLEARNPARFQQIAAAGRRFATTYLSQNSVFEYTRRLLTLYAECVSGASTFRADE